MQAYIDAHALNATNQPASGTIVGSNNVALYMPVWFPCDCTLYAMRFMATNGTGNYDIGLYNSAYARLVSSGSTAMSAAGLKSLAIADLRVTGGDLYYAAIAFSNSSATATRFTVASANSTIPAGFAQQTSAMPLPNPMVPATMGGLSFPVLNFGIR